MFAKPRWKLTFCFLSIKTQQCWKSTCRYQRVREKERESVREWEREKEGKRECASETSTGSNGPKERERECGIEKGLVWDQERARERSLVWERECPRERKWERVRGRERKEKLHYPLKWDFLSHKETVRWKLLWSNYSLSPSQKQPHRTPSGQIYFEISDYFASPKASNCIRTNFNPWSLGGGPLFAHQRGVQS